MRINRYIATITGVSRRQIDKSIAAGEVTVNGKPAKLGQTIFESDAVVFEHQKLDSSKLDAAYYQLVLLNKPVGYVCSRNGQGSKSVYELLPPVLKNLKSVGRLDKNSSGLLLLTNEGEFAHTHSHPTFHKMKVYEIKLNKPLNNKDKARIEQGVKLEDGPSKLSLNGSGRSWRVTMHEGRNRQIRRTFEVLSYQVIALHRTQFGDYKLGSIPLGNYVVEPSPMHIE